MKQAERKQELRVAMEQCRARTLRLLATVPDELLNVRVHDFYSPIGWHFGHVGMTEEYWVMVRALGRSPRDEHLSFLFANIPENPKDNRVNLPSRAQIVEFLCDTRRTVFDALDAADIRVIDPLLADGYAWEFAYRHECQHQETIVELLQLLHLHVSSAPSLGRPGGWKGNVPTGETSLTGTPPPLTPAARGGADYAEANFVRLPGGAFRMGSNDRHSYDNEKCEHVVEVESFELQCTPVTATEWLHFMADGGYDRRELWSEGGWDWRQKESATCPEYWRSQDNEADFVYAGPTGFRAIHPMEPASSISWYEADAYCRWAGVRLPTEAEWEHATRFEPATGCSRLYPWGDEPPTSDRASFGINDWKPDPVGSRPAGASALGVMDMAGGVWEWTSSPFLPYPGFEAFPYDGYSKEHMDGKHYVCRGGSWATQAPILRCSFRNWYVPTYRQGLIGLRCARDVD